MDLEENVEIARRAIDAFVRRDVEELRRLAHADLEVDWSASKGWLAAVYRGFDEAMRFYADYYAAFPETSFEAEEYIPTGDAVVVPNIAHQRGRDGIEVSARATFVFTVLDGRVARVTLYQEKHEALRALGLEQ